MKSSDVAIVGMACRYPDTKNPEELWENCVAQRRAFRNFPEYRLGNAYFSKTDSDNIYMNRAAVLSDYNFDRAKYNISGKNFRGTDLTHWLALDIATKALEDAGLLSNHAFPRDKTGVYIGNTMAGEFSRANIMRLRWPFVAKKVNVNLVKKGWDQLQIEDFLKDLETDYKSHFPEMFEDSLAGGLANTIAGRICNYYDFKGGGYTVDGACSSSLLAVIDACRNILEGDIKVALAGGVDLSLDPFELVGFSRTGALSKSEMLVYDKDSNGFWPGEGCGFVVLADKDFAIKNNLNIYAFIKGFGVSSDGQGGLTRPSVSGQSLAMERAYSKAAYPASDVTYFEGHGTGTSVGDTVELKAIINNITKINNKRDHYVGSIKANIGHTKAAAGIAGLLKAIKVVNKRIIPPITGCNNSHELFKNAPLEAPKVAVPFKMNEAMKASVSAMGFGGINTHITIEDFQFKKAPSLNGYKKDLFSNYQDYELFLMDAPNLDTLIAKTAHLLTFASKISIAEMADLSYSLYEKLENLPVRCGLIAKNPVDLENKLKRLYSKLESKESSYLGRDFFFGQFITPPRIGYLFPGQGSKSFALNSLLTRRFPDLQIPSGFPENSSLSNELNVTQPSIIGTSIIGDSLLQKMGVSAQIGIGHSLGEIAAIRWSKSLSEENAIKLATRRAEIMENTPGIEGLMLIISVPEKEAISLIKGKEIAVAAVNSPRQTVVSGPSEAIIELKNYLLSASISHVLLPVSFAFHSKKMRNVEVSFSSLLNEIDFLNPTHKVISTVTTREINTVKKVKDNLVQQLSNTVRFADAFKKADTDVDLWIELGGDATLENAVKNLSETPVTGLSLNGHTIKGFLKSAGYLWTMGAPIRLKMIFERRIVKAFDLDWQPSFISNPCEDVKKSAKNNNAGKIRIAENNRGNELSLLSKFKLVVSEKLELPYESVRSDHKMLDDLHMNSLEVGQLIMQFATEQNIKMSSVPTEYANATITEISEVLEHAFKDSSKPEDDLQGITPWTHYFEFEKIASPLPKRSFKNNYKGIWNYIGKATSLKKLNLPQNMLPNEGIVLCLQACSQTETLDFLDQTLNLLKKNPSINKLLVINGEHAVNGFFKSIYLENPELSISLITGIDLNQKGSLLLEAHNLKDFKEIYYSDNERYVKQWKAVFELQKTRNTGWTPEDIVIVSGGGKGITAECALSLGSTHNVRLILLGRSNPEDNSDLRANLQRFKAASIKYSYYATDITNKKALQNTVEDVQKKFGKITGIIHGAGTNKPVSWKNLAKSNIEYTLAPKLLGFQNIINCVNPQQLKAVVTFGSIIGESGMNGNADYALANEWLKQDLERLSSKYPVTKWFNASWSVWSGAGMGESLGVLENLRRAGVQPIDLAKGIELFSQWMHNFPVAPNLIISGRYGQKSTLSFKKPIIPSLRFIENIKLLYPEVELIADFELSEHTDLYLKDHIVSNQMVFPAVMGLEAFQQALYVLCPDTLNYSFEDVQFNYPIIVNPKKTNTLRIVTTRCDVTEIKLALRSSETQFSKDHFTATVNLAKSSDKLKINGQEVNKIKPNIDVNKDIYDNLLFHKGMFQVINSYEHLTPYHCIVKASKKINKPYFSSFVSSRLFSLEPTIRDAAFHAIQACDPEFSILPVSCKKIYRFYTNPKNQDYYTIDAREVSKKNKIYTYNIAIKDKKGNLLEYWEHVKLKVLSDQKDTIINQDLLKIIIQRRINEFTNHSTQINMSFEESDEILKRYDRKPMLKNGFVTRAHSNGLSFQIASNYEVGCDIEQVIDSPDTNWATLLGTTRFELVKHVAATTQEPVARTATRIWGILESLKKADLNLAESILFEQQLTPYLHQYKIGDLKTVLSYAFYSKEVNTHNVFSIVLAKKLNHVS
jgi:enediyne polyketide synthase